MRKRRVMVEALIAGWLAREAEEGRPLHESLGEQGRGIPISRR